MSTVGEVIAALAAAGIEGTDEDGVVVIARPAIAIGDYNGDALGTVPGFYVERRCDGDEDGYVYASHVDDADFVDGSDLAEMVDAVKAAVVA